MIYLNGTPVKFISFPSGESHLRVDSSIEDLILSNHSRRVTLKFQSNDDLINLMLLDNFLHSKQKQASLYIPYLPSSRQDRSEMSEANSLQVYSSIINNLKAVKTVTYLDPHSLAAPAALTKAHFEHPIKLPEAITSLTTPVYVSPDLGAVKRTKKLAGPNPVLIADKTRNYTTGEITGMVLLNSTDISSDTSFVVVDDICDGGRTFIELAKLLRQEYGENINLYLHVSHGFFSKGIDVLKKAGYCSVTCQNDMR